MDASTPDRREFLTTSLHALGGAWLALLLPEIEAAGRAARLALETGAQLVTFTAAEARTFEAAAATIFPEDDTPGAVTAGVLHYADRALDTFFSFAVDDVRAGLRDLDERAQKAGAASYADLAPAARNAVFTEFAQSSYFANLQLLTVTGMFSHPSHGGNRDGAGWKLLRIEHAPVYQPPFGWYDAEATRQTEGSPAGAGHYHPSTSSSAQRGGDA